MEMKGKSFYMTIVILTMMSMMGLLASDIYIPGLDVLTRDLNASPQNIQLTIGVYLSGLAVFQLFYGPLSDRFGRKPVILIGFAIYIIGSIAAACVQTVDQLLVARLFQACGACAGLVVGRAIIADWFDATQAPKVYNIIYPLVAASPAIAPLIGGYLISYLGWRSTFIFVFLFGVILMILTLLFIQESKDPEQRSHIHPRVIFSNYGVILKESRFWQYVIAVFTLYGAWFTFLTQAVFLYSKMGYSTTQIGYFYIPLAIAIYLGNLLCKAFSHRYGGESAFIFGLGLFFVGALLLTLMNSFIHVSHAWQLIIPMAVVAMSNGIILPLGMSFAIGLKPSISGSASGMVGFFQIGFSSLCASWFGHLFGISGIVMSLEILTLSVIAFTGYAFFRLRSVRLMGV